MGNKGREKNGMTADEIFRIQNMIQFLDGQRFVQKKRDYSQFFTSVLGVLCSRCIPQYESFVPQGQTERQMEWIASSYGSLKKAVRKLRRSLFGSRIDDRPLLVRELLSLGMLFGEQLCYNLSLLETVGWRGKNVQKLAVRLQRFAFSKRLLKIPEYGIFDSFVEQENSYSRFPKFNMAVVATMSAGKSTLINALLGHDYLPSRNEATTSTITSVQDKDGLQVLFGCVEREGELVPSRKLVTLEQMNQWNDDPKVRHIHLQGDLDNIGNHHAVVCVHDTPGTNNSGDTSHEAITMEFLRNNEMDAVVFVANGEHLCTTDEKRLLEDLRKALPAAKKVPVIFAMNKMDSHDSQKEDLSATVSQYRAFVEELGFDGSMVYPVSAKAARLFKMALKGRSGDFTEQEIDSFVMGYRKFTRRMNLSGSTETPTWNGPPETVDIEDDTYSKGDIYVALGRTGIIQVEQCIENLTNKRSRT